MIVQINTDKNIEGNERFSGYITELVKDELHHFSSNLSRVEVYFADENAAKTVPGDIRCSMEARIEGRQPIAVTHHADSTELAASGAIDKLKASLGTVIGKMRE